MEDFKYHPSVQQIQQKTNNGKQIISVNPFTQGQVLAVLESLNNNKTTGSDGIPAKVLKIEAEELSKPLTTLFNSCRANSVWTSDWNRGDWTRKKTRSPRRTIDQSPSSYV